MEVAPPDVALQILDLLSAPDLACATERVSRGWRAAHSPAELACAWRRACERRFRASEAADGDFKALYRRLSTGAVCTLFASAARPGKTLVPTLRGRGVVSVAAGAQHFAALTAAGELLAWSAASRLPRPVEGLPAPAVSVALGPHHSACVCADGSGFVWGQGQGREAAWAARPERVLPERRLVRAAAGRECTGFVDADGAAFVCGLNRANRLALRSRAVRAAAAAGGAAEGAGGRDRGLGNIFFNFRQEQFAAADFDEPVAQLAFGDHHAVAVTAAGELLAWGGAVGLAPARVAGVRGVVEAVCGPASTAVRDADGVLRVSHAGVAGLAPVALPEPCGSVAADASGDVWAVGAATGRLYCVSSSQAREVASAGVGLEKVAAGKVGVLVL